MKARITCDCGKDMGEYKVSTATFDHPHIRGLNGPCVECYDKQLQKNLDEETARLLALKIERLEEYKNKIKGE